MSTNNQVLGENRYNTYKDYEDVKLLDFMDMTKTQKLEFIEDYISATMEDEEVMSAVCDFLNQEKKAVIKKNTYNSKQRQNKHNIIKLEQEKILELMKDNNYWNIPQLIEGLGTGYEKVNNSWMTSRLTPLVKKGIIEKSNSKIKGDRKKYYKITNNKEINTI